MAVIVPTRQKNWISPIMQAVMRSVRVVSQAVLVTCVLDATGELFYPNMPKHSMSLYLCRLGSVVFGFMLVKAAPWRKATG